MTLQKVAKLAGVSVSTASKALSNSKDVSEETKKLVLDAAETLGYYSETKRRKLENRKTDCPTVGIICPEIISIYYSEIVTLLCRKIAEKGGRASVFISEFNGESQNDILRRCVAESTIDGVISLDNENDIRIPDSLPTVYLTHSEKCDCVHSDYESAFYDAAARLAELGHTAIAFAGEPLTVAKKEYFISALTHLSLPCTPRFIFSEEGRFEISGKKAAEKILLMPPSERPTAVLCAYDEIAYGLINTLRGGGVRIPEDISVIGVNDIPTSRYLQTPLTTIRHDKERLCSEALSLLFRQFKEPFDRQKPNRIPIACTLIERETTAPRKTV